MLSGTARKDYLNDPRLTPFAPGSIPQPAPGVVPKGVPKREILANDNQIVETNAWAINQLASNAYFNGLVFMGFPYLSELAQRAEYRAMAEVIATEMTREWIEFKSVSTNKESKTERIKELVEFMEKLDVQGAFSKEVQLDCFFGRGHLYLDTGDSDDPKELQTPIGNGRDAASLLKFKDRRGFLKALRVIEPIWTYPAKYVSNNPLSGEWYNPQSWFALGKEIHVTRFLRFVSREVPDMLKPSYMFGGLPLSQMAQPYVNNWLRARQSVSDLIYRYSVNVLATQMDASTTEGGIEMIKRAEIMSNMLNNNGMLMVDKASEEWTNVATPLAGLHELQAQAQEHQSAVSRIPLVKLLGISPSGLNASSEGEIQVWYEWVGASQNNFIKPKLNTVIDFCQLSLWGEVDSEIVWKFRPLKALDAKESAEVDKLEADTHAVYVTAGIVAPTEVREVLSADPDSPYENLEPTDEPDGIDPDGTSELDDESTDANGRPLDRTEGGARREDAGATPNGRDPEQPRREPSERAEGRFREPRTFGA